jgi:hypothetical protein
MSLVRPFKLDLDSLPVPIAGHLHETAGNPATMTGAADVSDNCALIHCFTFQAGKVLLLDNR